MGFQVLLPGRGQRGADDQVIVAVDASSVRVVLAASLISDVGWRASDRISVALGDGADAGLMRLARAGDAATGWKLSPAGGKRQDLRLRLRRSNELWSSLPPKMPAVGAAVRREGEALLIQLPWSAPDQPPTEERTDLVICKKGDVEYREAKRVLRGAGFDVHPYDDGTTDSSVNGFRRKRNEVVEMATLTLNATGATSD